MSNPEIADAVVRALRADVSEVEVLRLLTAHVDVVVGEDLVHRLVPFADRLAGFDFVGWPWAALSCGVAICAIDRPLGRSILSAARREFEETADTLGEGYGCFLEGLQDLGEGNMESAGQWWARARPLLGRQGAALILTSHLALAAYVAGDVNRAILLGEQALWSAENSGDSRAEMVACMGLALYHVSSGRIGLVDVHVHQGMRAASRVAPADRYELPMLFLLHAVAHTLRGDRAAAETLYTAAIDDSIERGNRWYEAIAFAVRAEFTAHWDPARSIADARTSLDLLDPRNETWFSRWARIAFATAHLRTGNLIASKDACEALLVMDLSPLDRGRTLLVAAELSARSDDSGATTLGEQARDLFLQIGALYWAARANMLLSRVDRRRREFHRRRAELCAGSDADDPAWQAVLRGPGQIDMRILGSGRVTVDGVTVTFETRAELECIAMLALAPGGLAPNVIGDRLWPDDDFAKVVHRVDNLISGLRRRLEPTARIRRDRTRVCLELLPGECDIRDALLTAEAQIESLTVDAHHGTISGRLREPLLDGIEAAWIGLEQHRLGRLADNLDTHARNLTVNARRRHDDSPQAPMM